MTTFIVEGRCDCPRLARLQLFADRVMHYMPNVYITFRTYTPQEYAKRFNQYTRSVTDTGILSVSLPFVHTPEGTIIGNDTTFMSYLSKKFKIAEEEPDLKGSSLEEAVQRLVLQNVQSLTEETNCKLYGVSVEKEAQQRYDDIATLACGLNVSKPAFKVLPDVKVLLTHDCGGRVMLLRSSIFHKLQQVHQQLFLRHEHTHSQFLLHATVPRSAASGAKGKTPKGCFRLLLHNSPLTHKHLVFVPARCLNDNQYIHRHPKAGLVSLVTGPSGTERLTEVVEELRSRNVVCLTEWNGTATTRQAAPTLAGRLAANTGDRNEVSQGGGVAARSASSVLSLFLGLPSDVRHPTLKMSLTQHFGRCLKLCVGSPCQAMTARLCGSVERTQDESRVLIEQNASPVLSVVLGSSSDLTPAQRDALLALEVPLVEVDSSQALEQIVLHIEALLRRAASTACSASTLSVSRRTPCRLGDEDWRAIRELVGEFECLVTFQWMPQAWRDHRRPLDSHLQVFPLPLSDFFEQGFGLWPAVERTLQKQRVLIPHLPFAHALVKVKLTGESEEPGGRAASVPAPLGAMASTGEEETGDTVEASSSEFCEKAPGGRKAPCEAHSHKDAFEIALRVVASVARGRWDPASEGASVVMGRNFLFLVPHRSPFASEPANCSCSDSSEDSEKETLTSPPPSPQCRATKGRQSPQESKGDAPPPFCQRRFSLAEEDTSAVAPSQFDVWKEWGLPHALAFVGGPALVNPLESAWSDAEEEETVDALAEKYTSQRKASPDGCARETEEERLKLSPLRLVRQRREPYGPLSLQDESRLVLRRHALDKPFSALAEFCVKLQKDEFF